METVWQLFARFCAHPAIAAALIALASRRPYLHIGGYMHRFWLVPFTWKLPFSIRIHHIKREDADPYLHAHPWNWRTIVLHGWYFEEDVFGLTRVRRRGDTRAASAETFHRISQVSRDGVWTLFIMGRKRNRWGFMTGNPARKVYYRDYVSTNGRGDLINPIPNYES
jgi:hypothetical protein